MQRATVMDKLASGSHIKRSNFSHDPPQSSEMNPIQFAWDMIEKRINARRNRPKNLRELTEVLLQEWNELHKQTLCKLVESLPKRLRALKFAGRLQTKY